MTASPLVMPISNNRDVPFLPWDEFITQFNWNQGEHVALIGPTGSGKTTLALSLLPFRTYVVVFGTKPVDPTLSRFGSTHGFKVMRQWKRLAPQKYPRRIIWPVDRELENMLTKQISVFRQSLNAIYMEGGWCVYIDELWWASKQLRLDLHIKTYLQQARSLGISLVGSMQRPAWVPVEMYSQSTHFFLYRANDGRDLHRLQEISSGHPQLIKNTVANLEMHEVLYVNTRGKGQLIRTMAPAP